MFGERKTKLSLVAHKIPNLQKVNLVREKNNKRACAPGSKILFENIAAMHAKC